MLEVLCVIGAFGIRGGLRVLLFSENLTSYRKIYDKNGNEYSFRLLRLNRVLSKSTISEDFLGESERRTAAYSNVREDSSAGSTTKIPDRGRLGKNSKSRAVIFIDGVNDRTSAESLKNEYFYLKRYDLPLPAKDEFYLCDLTEKDVWIANSDIKCKIVDAQNFGAGDLLEISHEGSTFFVPFSKENFPDSEEKIILTREAFDGFKN